MKTEAQVQQEIRLEAPRRGAILWRNNVGACFDQSGRLIRYGLANDSARMNKVFKSSDMVGINPVIITGDMVGHVIGQFFAIECKRSDFDPARTYGEDKGRYIAQKAFIDKVNAMGGCGLFANDVTKVWGKSNA